MCMWAQFVHKPQSVSYPCRNAARASLRSCPVHRSRCYASYHYIHRLDSQAPQRAMFLPRRSRRCRPVPKCMPTLHRQTLAVRHTSVATAVPAPRLGLELHKPPRFSLLRAHSISFLCYCRIQLIPGLCLSTIAYSSDASEAACGDGDDAATPPPSPSFFPLSVTRRQKKLEKKSTFHKSNRISISLYIQEYFIWIFCFCRE